LVLGAGKKRTLRRRVPAGPPDRPFADSCLNPSHAWTFPSVHLADAVKL